MAGRIAQAVRVEVPPKLDGTLSDPLWQEAVPILEIFGKRNLTKGSRRRRKQKLGFFIPAKQFTSELRVTIQCLTERQTRLGCSVPAVNLGMRAAVYQVL